MPTLRIWARISVLEVVSKGCGLLVILMKEIRFSDHAQLKMEILANHGIIVDTDFLIETVRLPDKLEIEEGDKLVAQKCLNENLVLRVVYREFSTFVLIITLYPGKRARYEKD